MAGPAHIRIRIGASVDGTVMKSFDSVDRRADKSAQNQIRSAQKSARETSATVQAEWNKQLSALNKASAAQDKLFARNAANAQKAAAQKARLDEQAAARAERAIIREQVIRERAASRKAAAEKRAADATIREHERAARASERAERRAQDGARRSASRSIDRFADRAGYLSSRFMMPHAPLGSMARRTAADMLRGAGVDFNLGSSVSRNVEAESLATTITNSAYMAKGEGIQAIRQDPKALSAEARAAADKYGLSQLDALSGIDKFKGKTGDLATARALLDDMAGLSLATGTNLGDMINAAGDVSSKLGGPVKSLEEAQERATAVGAVMRVIAGQGKLGAVEISDLAVQMSRVAGSAGDFEGDRSQNIIKLGAIAQLSRMGTATSAADAARSVSALSNTFRKNARVAAFEKQGVDIFSDKTRTKIRDPFEIIKDSLTKTGGDIPKLNKMFMDTLGAKAVATLSTTYKDAGGGAAGLAAIDKLVDGFTKDAVVTKEEERESVRREMETTARKAQQFQNKLDEIVSQLQSTVMPALVKLAPSALAAAEALSKFLQWGAENPWKLAGVALVAMVARAGIDAALSAAVTAIMARAGTWIMARLAMMGWASASFLPAAATTGAAGLSGGTALAGAAGAGMLGRFLAPTVLGKNVGAMGGMAAMLGAGLAWAAADDQSERTRKVSGGLSGFDIFGKMFDGFVSGGDVNPFKIVDKHQNDLAKQEAMGRGEMNADGSRPFNMTAPQELERFYADQLEATKKQTEGTDQIVKALQSGLVIKEMPPMPIPLPDLGGGPPRVSQ